MFRYEPFPAVYSFAQCLKSHLHLFLICHPYIHIRVYSVYDTSRTWFFFLKLFLFFLYRYDQQTFIRKQTGWFDFHQLCCQKPVWRWYHKLGSDHQPGGLWGSCVSAPKGVWSRELNRASRKRDLLVPAVLPERLAIEKQLLGKLWLINGWHSTAVDKCGCITVVIAQ